MKEVVIPHFTSIDNKPLFDALRTHLTKMMGLLDNIQYATTPAALVPEGSKAIPIDVLFEEIRTLKLSRRVRNSLIIDNISLLGQLLECNENRILKIPNIGRGSYLEIKEYVLKRGFTLGMNLGKWKL